MALQIWLPLTGHLNNQGVKPVTVTTQDVTVLSDGKLGPCYHFGDGSYSVAGIWLTNNLTFLGANRSVCAWVRPKGNHYHYTGTILSSGNWNSSKWVFGVNQTNTGFTGFDNQDNSYFNTEIPVNSWTHLCVTVDNGITRFYKNGVYLGYQERGSGGLSSSDAYYTTVGRETYADGYFSFNGDLCDVRVYDHTLSAREVKEISKGLVVHYPFNDPYVEPTNLIPNDHFGAWWSYGFDGLGTKTVYTGDTPNRDNFICRVGSTSATQARAEMARNFIGVSISQGEKVTFSCYVRGVGDSVGTTGFLHVYNTNGSTTQSDRVCSFTLTSEWTRVSGQFTWNGSSPTNAANWNVYVVGDLIKSGEYFEFCEPQFERKDHATPYLKVTPSVNPVNLATSLVPERRSGWGTVTWTEITSNSYHVRNQASATGGNPAYWDTFVYILPEEYLGKTITFSARVKNIYTSNVDTSATYIFFGQGNDGEYPSHGEATIYANELQEGTKLYWKGVLTNTRRYLCIETWNTNSNLSDVGIFEFDIYDIQIEVEDTTRNESTVYDCSGYGNDGVVFGSLQVDGPSPRYQRSSYFNGSSYVTGPTIPSGVAQSAAFWFYIGSSIPTQAIIFIESNSRLAFGLYAGNILAASTVSCRSVFSTSNLRLNAFNHICVVRPTGGSNPTIYVNGIEQGPYETEDYWGTSGYEFTIGKRVSAGNPYPFTGKLSDFRLYSTVLSAADVQELYNNPISVCKNGNLMCMEVVE